VFVVAIGYTLMLVRAALRISASNCNDLAVAPAVLYILIIGLKYCVPMGSPEAMVPISVLLIYISALPPELDTTTLKLNSVFATAVDVATELATPAATATFNQFAEVAEEYRANIASVRSDVVIESPNPISTT
jgi:hypothetical protein